MMEKALEKMAETAAGGKAPERVPGLDGMEGGLRTEGRPHLERVPSDSAEFVRPDRFDVPDWKDILTGQESGPKLEGFLPSSNGSWEGDEGDSIWKPDPDYVPLKSNPEGRTWEEIEDKYGMDGVEFRDGEPDFSEIAEATVEIDDFTENRVENFAQADSKLAEQWNAEGRDGKTDWTARDVAAYRKENNLTWHERSDMKTMDLVPSEVHNNIPHAGGISARKQG
ncbi:HNH endonuclease [uncultured Mailhella sp.]|uniref:HNH endonuclease n=1 Tax=uncultured Mailhella sp. TaxID=1981031 RepID=UPI0025D0ABAB|nr:HNH endonuclease [uncultured Mailhella sp.]